MYMIYDVLMTMAFKPCKEILNLYNNLNDIRTNGAGFFFATNITVADPAFDLRWGGESERKKEAVRGRVLGEPPPPDSASVLCEKV